MELQALKQQEDLMMSAALSLYPSATQVDFFLKEVPPFYSQWHFSVNYFLIVLKHKHPVLKKKEKKDIIINCCNPGP